MPPPDLTTLQGVAAYRAELRAVARFWRYFGLALVTFGAVGFVAVAKYDAPWTEGVLGPATIVALVIGWAILFAVILVRSRYHRRRMAG